MVQLIIFNIPLGIDESAVVSTLTAQSVNINLRCYHLFIKRKALSFFQKDSILVNQSISSINNILSTFTKTTTAINITCHSPGTLLRQQTLKIVMLTYQFITSRQIKDQVCSCKCYAVTRWGWCPDILTDFYTKLHPIRSLDQLNI